LRFVEAFVPVRAEKGSPSVARESILRLGRRVKKPFVQGHNVRDDPVWLTVRLAHVPAPLGSML
jgi:hypothetical protein